LLDVRRVDTWRVAVIKLTAKERDEARYMPLDGEAASDVAKAIVGALAGGLAHQTGRAPGKPFERAVAAVLCDFLQAEAMVAGRWSYRPMGANTFSHQRVGYRAFRRAVETMEPLMLTVAGGQQQWDRIMGTGPRVPMWKRATRLRPTEWLLRYMRELGVTPENWEEHFTLIVPEGFTVHHPLVLRRRTLRVRNERYRGYGMPLDLNDPKTRLQFDRIDRLNREFASVETSPVPFRGFQRMFNNGDVPGFDWDKGGRIYAVGGGYQTMKKIRRPELLLNGEETMEIDVKASHPTILAKLRGHPIAPSVDPYVVEDLPRDVVKAFWTMTLGHGGFHRAWPSKVLERLEPVHGRPLRKRYPLREVQAKVVTAFPFLESWGKDKLSALDLQFIESEAMLLTMERLAYGAGVFALSLHDGLIVQAKEAKVAEDTFREAYQEVVGVVPTLERREQAME
jgi:hypothetical protein